MPNNAEILEGQEQLFNMPPAAINNVGERAENLVKAATRIYKVHSGVTLRAFAIVNPRIPGDVEAARHTFTYYADNIETLAQQEYEKKMKEAKKIFLLAAGIGKLAHSGFISQAQTNRIGNRLWEDFTNATLLMLAGIHKEDKAAEKINARFFSYAKKPKP